MDINEIKQYLPHRYPFLLVDRVVELEPGERIVAYKNITANEEVFNGHFPKAPIFPGVMIIEALAQASGILGFSDGKDSPDDDTLYPVCRCGWRSLSPPGGAGGSPDPGIPSCFQKAPYLQVRVPCDSGWRVVLRGRSSCVR